MTSVDLDPQLEAFVRRQIDAGRYHDLGEIIRDGLRLLEEREATIGEIRHQLDEAVDDRSPDMPAEEVFARLEERSRLKRNERDEIRDPFPPVGGSRP